MTKLEKDLIAVCKAVLPYIKDCGYGGSNKNAEKAHARLIESLLDRAQREGK